MSVRVFQDNIFPRHVSDLMNLMHMMVYAGTDGEEKWQTYLTLKQKEYISLGLSEYYQCDHCIDHHLDALSRLETFSRSSLSQNINAMVLFLRIDTRDIGKAEKEHWIKSWKRFAKKVSTGSDDQVLPYLIGLAIGIARDDDFLIQFCGKEVKEILTLQNIDAYAAIGELESVVIFMKAAASKNRVIEKVGRLFEPGISSQM
jgi:AhpD family alkylhydroperoxidase